MMQFETSQRFPLVSSDSGVASTADDGGGGEEGSAPRKTSLSVLIDADMARLSEYLDGCHGVSSAFNDRQHQHHQQQQLAQLDDEQQRHHYQHHQQQHEAKYAPSYEAPAASTSTLATDELNGSADWACTALIDDGSIIAYNNPSGFGAAVGGGGGDYAREAHCSSSHFGVPCWMGDQCANGTSSLSLAHLPPPMDPAASGDDCHSGFAHFAMESPLEHGGKDVPSSSSSSVAALDAPSPVHMEHFMPFVHHGEPEMIFAGMDLSHATEFQGLHYQHQPHQLQEHDHHSLFFSSSVQYAPSNGCDIDQFIPQHQPHQQHQAMLQLDGTTTGFHDHGGDGLSLPWSTAGFLAPTHFIKSDARKDSLYLEPAAIKVKKIRTTRDTTATVSAPAPRVTRGRFSTALSQPSAPLMASGSGTPKPTKSSASSSFQAELRLVTELNDCYWKNGRKNLQCFPACPEHNDFYSMKMNNRKHSSVGVCRGPVYCHVIAKAAPSSSPMAIRKPQRTADCAAAAAALPSIPSGQHMKYEHGVGASSSGGSSQELFVLGRFERVPQRDNTDLVDELSPPPEFSSSVAFEEFRYGCFQAVEMKERRARLAASDRENLPHENGGNELKANAADQTANETASTSVTTTDLVRSTWFFLPDVWKVQPMLKKKRKATRSAPAQTFPFCFRVFVYTAADGGGGYTCVSSAVSSFFELYSTRTVDRVKRKYWSKASDASPIGTKRQARG